MTKNNTEPHETYRTKIKMLKNSLLSQPIPYTQLSFGNSSVAAIRSTVSLQIIKKMFPCLLL